MSDEEISRHGHSQEIVIFVLFLFAEAALVPCNTAGPRYYERMLFLKHCSVTEFTDGVL
jgi:hypothetical protein